MKILSGKESTLNSTSLFVALTVFFLLSLNAAAQELEASVDTDTIKIGEQITYSIAVEAEPEDVVLFPEGQTFMPLEMIDSFEVDTSRIDDRIRLLKEYTLTQFDSGQYTIPQQRVLINNSEFLTDSIPVVVNNVVVDTTKQKMFPIKPSVDVGSEISVPEWLWWLLAILLVCALVGFILFRRKKRREAAAQKLPPYEQALFELRQLDDSHLLEQREIKEYYSQLSAAVRRYLDGEVYDHAMESTTNELIAYLEAEREYGRVKLNPTTIERLKKILERSDLAKFANSKPDVITAKEDRSSVENVINDTKASIPQPSEEELLRDQKYREKLAWKKKRKKIIFGATAVVALLGAVIIYLVSTRGTDYLTETIFGNDNKELLEGEWVRSEYGTPPVIISTPDVLVRQLSDTLATAGKETFRYGDIQDELFVELSTQPVGTNFSLDRAVEAVYLYLEARGAKNIITKQEEIATLNGAEGLRFFGTMDIETPEGELLSRAYAILNFAESGGFQQVVIIYEEDDEYADEIAQRIVTSVELNNVQN